MSANIKLGQRVVIRGKADDFGPGTVRFVGPTKINPGIWVGIELDKPCS
jgi:dynactin complex subunit